MIPGDGENRSGVVAVGIVELIVIVTFLAKEIDDVSQMEKERRAPAAVIFSGQIVGHRIRNGELVRRLLDAAGIADGVKHDLSRALDFLYDGGPQDVGQR